MNDLDLPLSARAGVLPGGADAMYQRIVATVVEQRLRPGTKLPEEKLARLFAVSRTQVRKVLQRLAHEGLVELKANRGAFVAAPSRAYTRQIFEARRLIEPWLVEQLCAGPRGRHLAPLRKVVDEERRARKAGDRHAIVRLSGEFHVVLAELAGNPPLAKAMRELSAQTCLAILLYHAPTAVSCRHDEHGEIVAAIARGDTRAACQQMRDHLDEIEHALADPHGGTDPDPLDVLLHGDPHPHGR